MTSSTATSPAVSAAPVANSGELGARAGLIGLSRAELADFLAGLGEAPFRAKQLWHWIYNQGVSDFAAMTSLGKPPAPAPWRARRYYPARNRERTNQP